MKNPKAKGNNHERKIAKALSEWAGVKFMRTPMSGAIHNFNDKRVVSDIVPPLSIGKFPFSIEAKCVECSWEISNFIDGTSKTLKEHWKQCKLDAEREELLPMLVFTKNYRETYIMITEKAFKTLKINPSSYITLKSDDELLTLMRFKDFLDLITLEELLKKKFKF